MCSYWLLVLCDTLGEHARIFTESDFDLEVPEFNSGSSADRTFLPSTLPGHVSGWRIYCHRCWWWDSSLLERIQQDSLAKGCFIKKSLSHNAASSNLGFLPIAGNEVRFEHIHQSEVDSGAYSKRSRSELRELLVFQFVGKVSWLSAGRPAGKFGLKRLQAFKNLRLPFGNYEFWSTGLDLTN